MRAANNNVEPRLLRLGEAASFLGISLTTLYGLIGRGALRSVGLPGLRGHRFDRAELEILVESGKQGRFRRMEGAVEAKGQ